MTVRNAFSRWSFRAPLLAMGFLLLAESAPAQDAGFFGSEKGFELQPEVDVYVVATQELRFRFQTQASWIPSERYAGLTVGTFADWSALPYVRRLLSPDASKTRALQLQLGVLYDGTLDPGTSTSSKVIALQFDFSPRYFLPWSILLWNRNRFQARWTLGANDPFAFRYQGRLQFEREFEAGSVGLVPFANAEFYWQAPPSMWSELRLQAGLQCSFGGLGRRQELEVSYAAVTSLQPSHSWRPVVGVTWRPFF